ncbi:hypothetical protein M758_2G018000 [Ceratodon purpureus]|uniref:Uncharacterized protein n=1 Tax=Ceratodon purpureus TaxID=3225 RepID=A0A8T0IRW0_CERPU|nr:hypothetical protein KC19_2G018900 [Ceratodon purpureus]KAG0624975.1 hypothetical protein M758_2G018000 [Ceratodon purpureus]
MLPMNIIAIETRSFTLQYFHNFMRATTSFTSIHPSNDSQPENSTSDGAVARFPQCRPESILKNSAISPPPPVSNAKLPRCHKRPHPRPDQPPKLQNKRPSRLTKP